MSQAEVSNKRRAKTEASRCVAHDDAGSAFRQSVYLLVFPIPNVDVTERLSCSNEITSAELY